MKELTIVGACRHSNRKLATPWQCQYTVSARLCLSLTDSQCHMKITTLWRIDCFNDGRCIKTECRLLESICKRSYRHKTACGIFLQSFEKNAIDVCGKSRVEGTQRLRENMKVL